MSILREKVLKELSDHVSEKRALIESYEETAQAEMIYSRTAPGGIIGTLGQNACEARAKDARNSANKIKGEIEWHESMLAKYR